VITALTTPVVAVPMAAQDQPSPRVQSTESVVKMAQRIQKELVTLNQYGVFDELRFSIKDYVVTLKGYASRPTLKSGAENVVKAIEGVEQVVNNIEVLPVGRMDDQIRARVYAAVYGHPTLSRYNPNRGIPINMTPSRMAAGITNDPPIGFHPIHIIVKNGNVTLTGVVDNAGDKAIAGMAANGVRDVFNVENDLMIANESKPQKPKKK
jgi:osmotically-inducible protein OsmY